MSADSDSVYFEFATGTNGGDTTGMDVMISGNEGVNFGSENGFGTAFSDPSELFYLSPNGSLDQVSMVPTVDDTLAIWTDISWDWYGGNNGSYLQPGNIWVIHTRTTHAYAVLEVTASSGFDWSNPWFEFNYMYQPDGSNIFNPPTSPITITINGVHADTVQVGDSLVFQINFPDSVNQADLHVWVDMDDDGMLNPDMDVEIENPGHIMDNGPEDEDPQMGVYQMTIRNDDPEGLQRFSNMTFIIEVTGMMGGNDFASVHIEPIISNYSISGQITPPEAHIMVIAFPWNDMENDTSSGPLFWGAGSDSNGIFQIFLPDTGTYALAAFDFLGVTDGLIPDTMYFNVPVQGFETDYDFNFIEPNSVIAGMVTDEFMTPIPDLHVWIDNDGGPGFEAFTDSSGYFHVPMPPGDWRVGLDQVDLLPDYLVPDEQWISLGDYDSVFVDFMAYTTDAEISGSVTLNDNPWPGINVGAWSEIGWTESRTDSLGNYTLNVSSAADDMGGYGMGIWDFIPPDVFFVQYSDFAYSGETNADFVAVQVMGGIEGMIYDSNTLNPVSDAWIHVYNDSMDYGGGTGPDGFYHIPLPNGTYQVEAGAYGYEWVPMDSTITIQDQVEIHDFYLNPISLDGTISGWVLNGDDGSPIEDAEVIIGSDTFFDIEYTDASGAFSMNMPYGHFAGRAWKDGYSVEFVFDLELNPMHPDTTVTFYLPFTPEAALEGVVMDAEQEFPIWGANIIVENESYTFQTFTDDNGYFYLDLPADSFHVVTMAPGYEPSEDDIDLAPGDTAWLDIYLDHFMMTPPEILSIEDVPNDQGRQVRITWDQGYPAWFGEWNQFSIWRMTNEDTVWDFITTVPYHGDDVYSFIAPTLVDSNATTGQTGDYWSTFVVTAHTMDPYQFFDSEPESGYSVDNLIPSVPEDLVAAYYSDPGAVQLSWRPIADEDFDYYAIYRSTDSGSMSNGDPYGFTVDTTFVDQALDPGQTYYYVVTAFDFNGNESDPSNEVTATILSTDPYSFRILIRCPKTIPIPSTP
ncbi:MAG: hypothetical protein GXO90_01925 [FCB group bacterium]|nr:hypothetical protein [FCB group bacterium]